MSDKKGGWEDRRRGDSLIQHIICAGKKKVPYLSVENLIGIKMGI